MEVQKLNKTYTCYLKKTYTENLTCNKAYDKKYLELQEKYLENKDLV
jgi:hypothetical protein